ncbi:MAG: response regulator transcription factor [Spirosomataceae bacterium]
MTKILYVEDEPFLGKIVKESLESRGFEVEMVGDGRDAVNEFNQFQPVLCLLDIMLPHRDGYTLAQDIRRINPEMPIIFLTAKAQTEDVLKGFQSGGNDYIRKPFSMEELIVRIQNLLRLTQNKNKPSGNNNSIPLGQYLFYPQKYELHRADVLRKLSHRETELLSVLTENLNYTVNRRDILLRVWGDDSFFNSRNLDVYITRIREYLREDPTLEIVTLKGVGYLFKTE